MYLMSIDTFKIEYCTLLNSLDYTCKLYNNKMTRKFYLVTWIRGSFFVTRMCNYFYNPKITNVYKILWY